jgi:hypothetical protein
MSLQSEPQPGEELPEKAPTDSKAAPLDATKTPADTVAQANALSPEEQMALYEKDLKENDWGHQPC